MTKVRRPLSIDAALARIAGQVPGGWKAMGEAVGYEERTVRKWGDEDQDGEVNVPAAIKLDLLYQKHGGEGRPIYDVYGLMLGAAVAEAYTDQFEILRRVINVVKETGEAKAALVRLSLPGATEADRRAAQREVIEALDELKNILPLLEHVERAKQAPDAIGAVQSRAPP
ncbi:hypothetical protein M2336_002779 [Sphingobium sp. B1D7B]|uniref:hypothetical protein n=1 Tax=unclassified Sphingobium TaxID=2611147 RepID=UPI0022250E65|nr:MULTISPECIES: hypothetical protein [unclassified Sphingobium]MCW2366561.1 hypothetical protein [Sphingobium sp. B7D2B]MCW2390941.1 hypothetical protein [Sphingobium sp. B11D3A]MCW2406150.1 hypothetical protein [Sphingobium sp. B1D7B]